MEKGGELDGQVAIVTGAAAGIGLAAAEHLARAGAISILLDIDEKGGRTEAGRLMREGSEAAFLMTDVTDSAQVSSMAEEVIERYGRIDILVNNAGGFFRTPPFVDIDETEWESMIRLNLTSVFLCSKAVIPPMMKERRGRIINVSSQAGRTAQQPAPAYYSAAKAGVLGLTRALALELGPHNITVNAVAPGTTRTPRVDKVRGEEVYRKLQATTPLRRVAEAEDIARAIRFLASPGASFITGTVLDVNGGRFMA